MPSKPVRPNQFGVTLEEEAAARLRAMADRLKTKPATLAGFLLEEALDQRRKGASSGMDSSLLKAIRREIGSLRTEHYNAVLKLLNTAGGMSAREVKKWAKEFLPE
jgi:hypothetical protein